MSISFTVWQNDKFNADRIKNSYQNFSYFSKDLSKKFPFQTSPVQIEESSIWDLSEGGFEMLKDNVMKQLLLMITLKVCEDFEHQIKYRTFTV